MLERTSKLRRSNARERPELPLFGDAGLANELLIDGLPSVERLGVPVINDAGRATNIKCFIGGTTERLLEWVYLTLDGDFFNARTGEQISKASFDTALAIHTPGVQFENKDKANRYPSSRVLLEYLKGRSVYSTMYRPDVDALIFEHDGKSWVNSGLQARLPLSDPNWRTHEAWQIVREHIKNIFPGEGRLLVQWIAHNVQRLGEKILWAPVLVGVEGDGKTTIASTLLKAAMGSHVGEAAPEEVFSEFSDWAGGKAVRVIEEIRIDGERRTTAMNKLKPKITNTSVRITPKGLKGRDVANVTNYILCTNYLDALAITTGDRRYGVWKTRFESREAMLAERTRDEWAAYWKRLHAAVNDHPGVIRAWLLDFDLSDFDPKDAPPVNLAKLGMIKAAKSGTATEVQEAIDLGGVGVCSTVIDTISLNARITDFGGRAVNSKAIAGILEDGGWRRHDQTVSWQGKNRRLYYRADAFTGLAGVDLSRELRRRLDEPDRDFDSSHELSSGYKF